ncbi:MAG TPA: aminotransferase class V-fold PLP-dependent enzyme [Salinisphaeraceae bacterium]|nr:aminotransferase class V-fold PLP-dependent enzyme [Salinisphaeraceae bacterium]
MTQNPLFIPGPTNLPDRLRRAMDIQTINHRATEFSELFMPLRDELKEVFKTRDGEIFIFPATGTGGWEAAVTNTLDTGAKVLTARYGMFCQRWMQLCKDQGFDVHTIERPWGEGVPADEYERVLRADTSHEIKAVLVCHNETSTGVTSDIMSVRRALDNAGHPALLFVDGVSSIASIDFRMDEWGVDIAVTGSQKGFMLGAGMAILAVSPKALAASESASHPRAFFDFQDMRQAYLDGGSFPYTPPLSLLNGLRESLAMLREEGLDNVFARHQRIAEGVRRAVHAWGLDICARSPDLYSDTVTAIHVPEGYDSGALVRHAHDRYRVNYGGGLGDLAGQVFRIGHLGDMTEVMALSGLATIEMAMQDLDYPIELGSGVAAAQAHYCT